jgi:sulfite reductase alpha subunit-like flavoprotein
MDNAIQAPNAGEEEVIHVLFGSQTGNSEQAAQDFCAQWKEASAQKLKNPVHTRCTSLDDFLEVDYAPWTRVVVIYCSSYGVGQAPLGASRFRELCNHCLQQQPAPFLQGVHYALCGLGDSKYRTFFENPTTLDQGLTAAGAKRIGTLGCADASHRKSRIRRDTEQLTDDQGAVIAQWTRQTIPQIIQTLQSTHPLSANQSTTMQQRTNGISQLINPEFVPPKSSSQDKRGVTIKGIALLSLILVFLLVAGFYLQEQIPLADSSTQPTQEL